MNACIYHIVYDIRVCTNVYHIKIYIHIMYLTVGMHKYIHFCKQVFTYVTILKSYNHRYINTLCTHMYVRMYYNYCEIHAVD